MRIASTARSTLWIALPLAFALAACGNGGGGDGGTTDSGVDAGDAGRGDAGDTSCATLALSYCQHVSDCTQGIGIDALYGNVAACQMRVSLVCETTKRALGAQVTSQSVITCAAGITSSDCTTFFADRVPECAFVGTRADGMNCALDAQCQSGTCVTPFGSLCGTCGQHHEGDPCGPGAGCGRTLVCARTGRCRAPVATGGACDDDTPCDEGLGCVYGDATDAGSSGTCARLGGAVDVACDPFNASTPACDPDRGLYCNATSHTCRGFSFVTPGMPCSAADGTFCVGGGACLPPEGGGPAVCVIPEADQGNCDTAHGPTCSAFARCIGTPDDAGVSVTGACQPPRPDSCR